jgi:hypothetical protein
MGIRTALERIYNHSWGRVLRLRRRQSECDTARPIRNLWTFRPVGWPQHHPYYSRPPPGIFPLPPNCMPWCPQPC